MAEKRKKNKRQSDEPETPTKEEYAVASFLRFNVTTREGKLRGLPVTCFIASKAVDALLDSQWATKKGKTEAIFTTRQSCVDYCHNLLLKGLFHRALRTEKKKDKDKKTKKLALEDKGEKTKKSKKKEEKDGEEKPADEEKESEKKVTEKKDDEKKKKKKLKVEMHDEQHFLDGEEVYVWIYDPTPLKNKIIGLLLVLGAIGVCLFPLWPPEVRLGVYYLSLAAAGFVGFILVLCVIRLIGFCIVWAVTMGKHHLWILPNLTEDVGFFDSFKPLYKHEYQSGSPEDSDKSKDKTDDETAKKDKNGSGDNREDGGTEDKGGKEQKGEDNDNKTEKDNDDGQSEENNGTDNTDQSDSNGYEVVSHDDLTKDSK